MVGRVIVIDDNPEIARDFAQLLGGVAAAAPELDELELSLFGDDAGCSVNAHPLFEVQGVLQGIDGLHRVEQAIRESRPFSVAVVDMRMPPGWNGVETSKRILNADPRIRIVICSAYAEQSQSDVTEALGTDAPVRFLQKPFDPMAARQLVSELQREWESTPA